jgi:hypothetical protein
MTDELPLRVEAEELVGAEQFRVTSPAEVRALLVQLAEHREFICIYVDNTDRFALSSVLGVTEDELIFDLPNGPMRQESSNGRGSQPLLRGCHPAFFGCNDATITGLRCLWGIPYRALSRRGMETRSKSRWWMSAWAVLGSSASSPACD